MAATGFYAEYDRSDAICQIISPHVESGCKSL